MSRSVFVACSVTALALVYLLKQKSKFHGNIFMRILTSALLQVTAREIFANYCKILNRLIRNYRVTSVK
jgi:hypothetical protein